MSNANNLPALRSVSDQLALAHELAVSQMLPKQYQKNPSNLLWAIQYAEALQVHPMAAINGIHVIEGKPTASAQLIGGLVRRAGHVMRVKFDRQSMTATAVIIRVDDPDFTFESVWTMDRAKAANLTNKSVWKQYPDAMLKARAITEVARDACPEALFGVIYTPEELGAEVAIDADGEQVPVTVTATIVADTPAERVPSKTPKNAAFKALVAAGVDRDNAVDAVAAAWDATDHASAATVTQAQADAFAAEIDKVIASLGDDIDDAEIVDDTPSLPADERDPFAIDDVEVAA
jgi:hypothetical protein